MEFKDYVTITLSVLAFGLGLFNLWWGTFRRRIALFFIQGGGWSYMLVNGGKTDILIVGFQYWFKGKGDVSTGPNQTCSAEMPILLKAGAALHQTITFENQREEFAFMAKTEGRPSGEDAKALTATAHISWVDNNGDEHFDEVPAMDVVIQDGWVRAWRLLARRVDLSPSRFRSKEDRPPLAAIFNFGGGFKSK